MSLSLNKLMRLFLDDKSSTRIWSKAIWSQHMQVYKKNEIIFSEGEKAGAVFRICKGKVILVKKKKGNSYQENASYGVIDYPAPGEILGLPAAISDNTYSTSAIAKSKVSVLKVDKDALLLFLANHPDLYASVARKLSRKIVHYEYILFNDT